MKTTEEQQIVGGRRVINGVGRRRKWTWSRLVVMEDGSTQTLLRLLALHKYGPWDSLVHKPIWTDGDSCNETLDNVSLLEMSQETRPASSLGVPAGTPEYQRRWRRKNLEKMKAYQSAYGKRIRAQAKELRRREAEADLDEETPLQAQGGELLDELRGTILEE